MLACATVAVVHPNRFTKIQQPMKMPMSRLGASNRVMSSNFHSTEVDGDHRYLTFLIRAVNIAEPMAADGSEIDCEIHQILDATFACNYLGTTYLPSIRSECLSGPPDKRDRSH